MLQPVRPRVAVLADDLIWASRLVAAVERAGAEALPQRSVEALAGSGADAALVDLNGRGYDGLGAVREAAATGCPVIAVGQHEDVAMRRQALAAGASQVHSYNRFFREGPKLVARLVEAAAPASR